MLENGTRHSDIVIARQAACDVEGRTIDRRQLAAQFDQGLVLDLRYNPGGLLNEAEAIADLFLDEGVIVSTKGRAYPERITRAEKPGTLPQFPIAVLLNGSSASESVLDRWLAKHPEEAPA